MKSLFEWVARRASKLAGHHPRSDASALLFGGGDVISGVPVNEWTALNYSACWAAKRVISESLASLPLTVGRRLDPQGREIDNTHPVARLFNTEPNPEMSSFVFRETLQAHVCDWGGAYAEIERTKLGRPVALWPITPDVVKPFRAKTGEIAYEVRQEGPAKVIPARDMLHVPGLGFDGLTGYSVITLAREGIGLGLAAERYGAAFFGNGATPGGVLEHPGELSEPAQDRLRRSWEDKHRGPNRAGRLAILEEGMKFARTSIPPEDAQFLQTRQFQIEEVARWYNIPPLMLRDLRHATYSNIEHQSIDFVSFTVRPWAVRWEQEIARKLLTPEEKAQGYDARHDFRALLRGDIESRYKAYAIGRQWGWLNVDDIRDMEDLNPLPGNAGSSYLVPINMVSAETFDNGTGTTDTDVPG